jgi:uncharacterized protein YyaL (SSP411 family)
MLSIFGAKMRAFAAGAITSLLVVGGVWWWTHREPRTTDFREIINNASKLDLPTPTRQDLLTASTVEAAPTAPGSATDSPDESAYTNRLSRETSPYLRMHAHNPVDWYPWGDEAFKKARAEQKPILLSVGYAACHWCGVMERESFTDPVVAAIMNRHYVSIKVDREERPDVDRVYLLFLQLTTGGSGYPMTILLTPELKPILGGTYFPKEASKGTPSFMTFLTQFTDAWNTDRENVLKAANTVTESIRGHIRDQVTATSAKAEDGDFKETYDRLRAQYDRVNGGFGTKPKYAQPVILNFLLRYYSRSSEREALDMTVNTLRKVADGGLRDQLGGGFYRYATDARWQVPHFEKMLYDQSQLAMAYLDAYQATRDPWHAAMARETLDFVLRDMKSPDGGFYSAIGADSAVEHGKTEVGEGAVYLWETKTIETLLGAESAGVFSYYYGVEPAGNIPADQDIRGELKGRNVLAIRHSIAETASRFKKTDKEIERVLEDARKKLLAARGARPQPLRDDKVVTGWNGLMISALSRAAQVLDDARYAREAASAATLIKTRLYDARSGALKRQRAGGQAAVDGFLEDYAFLIQGLFDLYEASFDPQWLVWAEKLQNKQDEVFWDSTQGTYFATTASDSSVLFRMRDEFDGAEPSANSIAAMNLLRLWQLTDNAERKAKADKTFAAFSARLKKSPDALPQLMAALDFARSKPKQIVIAGKANAADTRALLRLVHERYIPNKLLILADGAASQAEVARRLPFIEAMHPLDNKATAYICEEYACRVPSSDPRVVARILDGKEP